MSLYVISSNFGKTLVWGTNRQAILTSHFSLERIDFDHTWPLLCQLKPCHSCHPIPFNECKMRAKTPRMVCTLQFSLNDKSFLTEWFSNTSQLRWTFYCLLAMKGWNFNFVGQVKFEGTYFFLVSLETEFATLNYVVGWGSEGLKMWIRRRYVGKKRFDFWPYWSGIRSIRVILFKGLCYLVAGKRDSVNILEDLWILKNLNFVSIPRHLHCLSKCGMVDSLKLRDGRWDLNLLEVFDINVVNI